MRRVLIGRGTVEIDITSVRGCRGAVPQSISQEAQALLTSIVESSDGAIFLRRRTVGLRAGTGRRSVWLPCEGNSGRASVRKSPIFQSKWVVSGLTGR